MTDHSDNQTPGPSAIKTPTWSSWIVTAALLSLFALITYMPNVSEQYERIRYEEAIREKGARVPAAISMVTIMEKEWILPERPSHRISYRFL